MTTIEVISITIIMIVLIIAVTIIILFKISNEFNKGADEIFDKIFKEAIKNSKVEVIKVDKEGEENNGNNNNTL